MPALLNLPSTVLNRRLWYGVESDFDEFVTGDKFTDTSADTGAAVANVDAAGGTVTLTTGGTDNNECYLLSTKELFLFANNKPLLASARLKFTEANTDDANVFFGLMNAVAADSIVDDGAGPKSSYSGAIFYKVDGGTNWKVQTSIATTRTGDTELTAANALNKVAQAIDTAYHWFDIESVPFSSTQHKVNFYIDEVQVYSITQTYTSATEMNLFVGVKAGGANSEVVTVDYLGCWQKR
jgi:hypothetical protein